MVIHPVLILVIIIITAGVAEILHVYRIRKVNNLAFGPGGRSRSWTYFVPILSVISLAMFGWGLATLYNMEPKVFRDEHELSLREMNRILILYDVSPSMDLKDAGAKRDISRRRRTAELMDSILERIQTSQTLISIIAVYTEAKPVVIDAKDQAVIDNIFSDLPFKRAFRKGKTNLVSGFIKASEMAEKWPAESTTLIVFTDGDTIKESELPLLPSSINNVIIVGVGPTDAGTFIDGHFSRQDVSVLNMIGRHYGAVYHNGNKLQVPTETFNYLTKPIDPSEKIELSQRGLSILAVVAGAFIFAFIPIGLAVAGTSWRVTLKPLRNGEEDFE